MVSIVAGRRTNLALLIVLPLAGLTGISTFLVGSGPVSLVVITHAVVGLAVLILLPWKSIIIRRGLRRGNIGIGLSILLMISVLLAVATGLGHSTGLARSFGAVNAMQLHVGAAIVAIAPFAAHLWLRRTKPRKLDLSRRAALRMGGIVASAGLLYAALETSARLFSLPGANRRATGSYERSSGRPEGMPITAWLLDEVPTVDPDTWRLAVVSAGVERDWRLDELSKYGDSVTAILDCTSGWWSEQAWTGVRLVSLLGPNPTGSVLVTSATGYQRRLPLTDDLLLAVGLGGARLSAGHGAPVRLVVPGRRGYHWVKWVQRIDHDQQPWWVQSPLPLQ